MGTLPVPQPQVMYCREFKEKHVALVDDTLAGVELVEMQRHLSECRECAERDARIRRALLLVHNLPTIEVSEGFSSRLSARLAESRAVPVGAGMIRGRITAIATLAAAAMIGYIAITLHKVEQPRDLRMSPVVASVPGSEIAPIASPSPTIIASAPAGLAIWPAALLAEQAPVHFAHARFANASLSR